jgi:hypothetical protein
LTRIANDIHDYRQYIEKARVCPLSARSACSLLRPDAPQRNEDLETSKARVRAHSSLYGRGVKFEYFGVALADIVMREGTSVPNLITKCFQYLASSCIFPTASIVKLNLFFFFRSMTASAGLQEEGLFRVAAAKSRVAKFIADIDASMFITLSCSYVSPKAFDHSADQPFEFEPKVDADVVTDIVKHFFRELPEPLLTYALYEQFLQANCTAHFLTFPPVFFFFDLLAQPSRTPR